MFEITYYKVLTTKLDALHLKERINNKKEKQTEKKEWGAKYIISMYIEQ